MAWYGGLWGILTGLSKLGSKCLSNEYLVQTTLIMLSPPRTYYLGTGALEGPLRAYMKLCSFLLGWEGLRTATLLGMFMGCLQAEALGFK